MAKGKKNKVGGKARGSTPRHRNPSGGYTPKSKGGGGWTSDEDFETPSFSMRDAAHARESGGSHSNSYSRGSGFNLRHQSMSFVRSIDNTLMKTDDDDDVEMQEEDEQDEPLAQPQFQMPKPAPALERKHVPVLQPAEPTKPVPTSQATKPQSRRAPSPAGSESSDEVVLFRGRTAPAPRTQQPKQSAIRDIKPETAIDTAIMPHNKKERSSTRMATEEQEDVADIISELLAAQDAEENETPEEQDGDDAWEDDDGSEWISEEGLARIVSSTNGKTRTSNASKQKSPVGSKDAAIQAALDDYVENMRENGDMEDLLDTSGVSEGRPERDGWNSSDLEDFDELSTSEEILEAVEHVLSKRNRPSGLQYLIVWEGQSVDEARWIPHEQLTMKGAVELIATFEEEEKNIPEYIDDEDEDDSDDDDDEEDDEDEDIDSGDDEEAFADELDLIERRQARMDDEKLARLLAKQEALGLGSDELLIFDQAFADNDPDNGEFSDGFVPFGRSRRKGRGKPQSNRRGRRNLEVLGDDLEDMDLDDDEEEALFGQSATSRPKFDITDRARPSITKGTDPLTWGLSDTDEAETLRSQWAADRSKKAAKKQEREELRAQGMLGKKNKFKPDLKARYNEGMDINQLGQELEEFLLRSELQSRALPPMEKRDRKMVHEIASLFGLKSLSKGSGKSRFPVLQKTSKTIDFDAMLFARLRTQVERRFMPRMDKKGKGSIARGVGPMVKRQGGINRRADVGGYREGDVVGANAPELGIDNRGRAMLEKMGWSLGMALGGEGAKGILTPIQHVVKNSRAGLG